MGVPQAAWGFQLMAVIPLLQGFRHFDIARAQRGMNFGPFMRTAVATEFLTLLAVYPMYLVFGDYRVGLFILILQEILLLALSHLVAARAYRLGFDRELMVRAFHFGWPLLLNAVLLYGVFQGDRLIVANRLGPTELGLFSLAFMLTLVPTKVLSQTQTSLFLPKLAALQDAPEAFARLGLVAVETGLVIGLAVATGFALFGPDTVLILFGEKYAGALTVLIWLAVMQAVRVAKLGISTVAVARGETRSPMAANILRVLLLPVAWLAVGQGAGLVVVVWLAILGEGLGLGVALFLLHRWHRVPAGGLVLPLGLWGATLLLVCIIITVRPPVPEIFGNSGWPQALLLAVAAGAVLGGMGNLRRWLAGRFRRREV
jgi:O-antigen/teichoic acid export membrane protein